MHRIDSPGNVGGLFDEGTPGVTEATELDADWFNAVQEELRNLVVNLPSTGTGVALNKADYDQVRTQLLATFGRLGFTNTWTAAQTFQAELVAEDTILAQGSIDVTGSATVGGVSTFNDNVDVNGDVAATGAVSGASLSSSGTASVGTNATVGGTLGVTGATTLTGALAANGGGTLGSGFTANASSGSTGATPTTAFTLGNGHLVAAATAPNSDASLVNTLGPTNINKVNAMVVITAGAISVAAGFNVASVAKTTFNGQDVLRVTFAGDFNSANYVCVPGAQTSTTIFQYATVVNKAATHVDIALLNINAAPPTYIDVDDAGTNAVVDVVCYGAQ